MNKIENELREQWAALSEIEKFDPVIIEKMAEQLNDKMGEITYPIDVWQIAARLGLKIPFDLQQKDKYIGVLDMESKEIKLPCVRHNPNQKITIAYELAHYLFDVSETKRCFESLDSEILTDENSSPENQRARRFASACTMPKTIYRIQFKRMKEQDYTSYEILNKLADLFQVSPYFVKQRYFEIFNKEWVFPKGYN